MSFHSGLQRDYFEGLFIICAIGDDEHHRLRMLMDEVFDEQNFLSNVTWQGGRDSRPRFTSRGADYMLIYARDIDVLGASGVKWTERKPGLDQLVDVAKSEWRKSGQDAVKTTKAIRVWLRGAGSEFASGLKQYGQVDNRGRLYRSGDLGCPAAGTPYWYDLDHPVTGKPVRKPSAGWRHSPETMMKNVADGRIIFGKDETKMPSYKRFITDSPMQVPGTVFVQDRAAASNHLTAVLGDKRFPFPKDHTVLMRWLRMVAPDDAVILDFFGGSGSTLEAIMRLNDEDGGTRQCIIATSNEVGPKEAKAFAKAGVMPHDEVWEAAGVFENVLRPRITSVVTGVRPDGSALADKLKLTNPERHHVAFFDLTWLPGSSVRLQRRFADLEPLLWMRAGGHGAVLDRRRHAVLFDVADLDDFAANLRDDVTMAFVVTDSSSQFALATERLHRPGLEIVRLPIDYLGAMR